MGACLGAKSIPDFIFSVSLRRGPIKHTQVRVRGIGLGGCSYIDRKHTLLGYETNMGRIQRMLHHDIPWQYGRP